MGSKKYRYNGTKELFINDEVSIITYNIGNCSGGVYNNLFSASPKKVKKNLKGIIDFLEKNDCDICLLQEADYLHITNYFISPCKKIANHFKIYGFHYGSNVNILNFYNNGNITLSKYNSEYRNYKIPIKGKGIINNYFIVHKCLIETRITINDTNQELIIYNIHLTPFIKNKSVRREQITHIMKKAREEYTLGNYVVIGGDWNIDLMSRDNPNLALTKELEAVFGDIPWIFEIVDGYTEYNNFIRNAEPSYKTIDGFLFSPNLSGRIHSFENFEFSDHSPVELLIRFKQ